MEFQRLEKRTLCTAPKLSFRQWIIRRFGEPENRRNGTAVFYSRRSKREAAPEPSGNDPCVSGIRAQWLDCPQETGAWQTGSNYPENSDNRKGELTEWQIKKI